VDAGTYMDTLPQDKYQELRRRITDDIIEMGIRVKIIHHEFGPGQQEIEFDSSNALSQADNIQTSKLTVKVRAFYNGLISTFLPKPFPEFAGSGLHIHQYLKNNGNNVFIDKENDLSDTLKFYIGGIQKHIKAISAILNPSTNSYRRLVPHHEAPVYNSWGVGNRTALIRVPGYEKSARIEYRAGDASMNIYLGTAILLEAGLDGIKNKIWPNEPTLMNVDMLSDEERKRMGIQKLPESLEDSLSAFKKSTLIKKVFGKEFIKIYLKFKTKELQEYMEAKKSGKEKEWEYKKYLFC